LNTMKVGLNIIGVNFCQVHLDVFTFKLVPYVCIQIRFEMEI
jgi:hypothetical protein